MHLFFLHLSRIWCWFTKSQIGVLRCNALCVKCECILCTAVHTILWTVRVTRRFMYLSNVSIIGNNIYGQLKQDHEIRNDEKSMSALDVVRMQQRCRRQQQQQQRRSWFEKKNESESMCIRTTRRIHNMFISIKSVSFNTFNSFALCLMDIATSHGYTMWISNFIFYPHLSVTILGPLSWFVGHLKLISHQFFSIHFQTVSVCRCCFFFHFCSVAIKVKLASTMNVHFIQRNYYVCNLLVMVENSWFQSFFLSFSFQEEKKTSYFFSYLKSSTLLIAFSANRWLYFCFFFYASCISDDIHWIQFLANSQPT